MSALGQKADGITCRRNVGKVPEADILLVTAGHVSFAVSRGTPSR
jgi:hypothetical protein